VRIPPIGIALRTALLSWLVTLTTLLIFVVVILPWQEHTLLKNLESKAQSVAISLHDVAASAAVNEDYSSVVDHCKEMLDADDSLAYLVITKSDGFSLIQDRSGWRSEAHIEGDWLPQKRETISSIRYVPLFHTKAFNYSQPFDYSGIQWGWIHVGLSIDKYYKSLANLYWITLLVAIACGALSLLASVVYARRLVSPILNLRSTVQSVAGGDLSARAAENRDDELGSLATSVNSMTEALLRRDQILASVQFAAQRFLGASNWRGVIDDVLAQIGRAAAVDRAYVIENELTPDGRLVAQPRQEWVAPHIEAGHPGRAPKTLDYRESGFARWMEVFQRREIIASRVSDLPEPERALLAPSRVRSLLVIPIVVDGVWWGLLGLDDCTEERRWSDAERDSLQAAADMLGAAIARQHAQDQLLEAKDSLERRVNERTEALHRENIERKQAESALARSLSVINATLESTLDGIMVIDQVGRVKHFNRRFARMWRIAPEALASGQNREILALMAVQLKDPEGFTKSALGLHDDPVAESFGVIEFSDGRIFERFTRPQHADGVSAGRVWCYRDITERKRAEAEITYERDLLQTLMDSLPDMLYFKDLDCRFVRVSRSKVESSLDILRDRHRLARQAGQAEEAYPPHLETVEAMRLWLAGKTDFDIFTRDTAQQFFDEENVIIRSGRPLMGKLESIKLPSGAFVWYLATKMPWRDEQGRIIGIYGVSKDITPIKEAEEKLSAVHEELIQASREAGMAEVATGVLHNVGNVLNSVNVSATLVRDTLLASEVFTLSRVAELIAKRKDDLASYFTTDPKGRLIPGLVVQLSSQLIKEHALLHKEHEQLARNVEHIKEIVAMQQNYANVSGALEKASVAEMLDDALQIHVGGLASHGIEVVRHYQEVPPIVVDKHKVMQILVNIINNAKYSMEESGRDKRQITLGIGMGAGNRVRVSVADNGMGIPSENLTRIFSRGFTTRKNGHGFGLHSGAIAAREMGGLLLAESDGIGKGAIFTLELPIDCDSNTHE
jgi:PAS domain S-box-containing protein